MQREREGDRQHGSGSGKGTRRTRETRERHIPVRDIVCALHDLRCCDRVAADCSTIGRGVLAQKVKGKEAPVRASINKELGGVQAALRVTQHIRCRSVAIKNVQ